MLTVFWDIGPCSLVEVDRRFRGAYLRTAFFKANHRAIAQKAVIFILAAVRIYNLTLITCVPKQIVNENI
jgi:hypothetical protein